LRFPGIGRKWGGWELLDWIFLCWFLFFCCHDQCLFWSVEGGNGYGGRDRKHQKIAGQKLFSFPHLLSSQHTRLIIVSLLCWSGTFFPSPFISSFFFAHLFCEFSPVVVLRLSSCVFRPASFVLRLSSCVFAGFQAG